MTNNDGLALKLEQIEWLHGAAEEAAAVNLKMTMKPEEILQITSILLALLAEREADKKRIEFLKEQLSQLANFNPDWDKLEAATDSLREHVAALTAAQKRIAELESRKVYLSHPKIGKLHGELIHVWPAYGVQTAIAHAGIKLEVGE